MLKPEIGKIYWVPSWREYRLITQCRYNTHRGPMVRYIVIAWLDDRGYGPPNEPYWHAATSNAEFNEFFAEIL